MQELEKSICKIRTANDCEVNIIRFEDSKFLNISTNGIIVNGHLDGGHKFKYANMPNGGVRIMLLDSKHEDEQGDMATIMWFDVTDTEFVKMMLSKVVNEVIEEHKLF